MKRSLALATALASVFAVTGAGAATYQVTAATLASFQKTIQPQLKCGDAVIGTGAFPAAPQFYGIHPANCQAYTSSDQLIGAEANGGLVLFDFTQASVPAYTSRIYNSDHFIIRGGAWGTTTNTTTDGVINTGNDTQFVIEDATFLEGTGLSISGDSVFRIVRNWFRHTLVNADAVDYPASTQGEIANNTCLMLYFGLLGDHGDCGQTWNIAGVTMTLNAVWVHDNSAIGNTQGWGDRFLHVGSGEPPLMTGLRVDQNVEAVTGWASDASGVEQSEMKNNTIFSIVTSGNFNSNACPLWILTDNPTGGTDSGTTGNVVSGNNTCIAPNTSQTMASTYYQTSQIATLEKDAIAQDAAAKGAPGTAAAKTASTQAATDLTQAQAILAQISATLKTDTTESTYATSYIAYMTNLSTDAAKEAAVTPLPAPAPTPAP